MKRRDLIAAGAVGTGLLLASCGGETKAYVDHVLVEKRKRKMTLFANGKKIKVYDVDLGFKPAGHKQFEGDGKTPEGKYYIKSKNPNSAFHLSLEISYPNRADYDYAASRGRSPGGEIFIHGGPTLQSNVGKKDWTAGCIAVTNLEIEEIYRWVKVGALVEIRP